MEPRPVYLVNGLSGGQKGRLLIDLLRRWAGRPVMDVVECDLEEVVAEHHGTGVTLVACGGDGTAAAILEVAHRIARHRGGVALPVAVLALGTGNDLANHLGWPAVNGPHSCRRWLACLPRARCRLLDRWVMTGPDGVGRGFYNYCSWGLDARVARNFDRLRRLQPSLFRSRLGNKLIYAMMGAVETGSNLPMVMEGFDRRAPPSWARIMLLANIASYAGGGTVGERARADDGRIDGYILGGNLLMGLGTRGLRQPAHLGAVRTCRLHLQRRIPMQLDGEPVLAEPGDYRIVFGGRVRVLGLAPEATG